ncbi:MAG TPA: PIN domain-containing protein [Xanthobacteraceae bacterium]|nr:PIN domain-containing protein [Xanthobacteraceae bacterium]
MPNGKMNCFADTNLIVYTVDPNEPEKRQHSKDFLNRIINRHTLVLSPQSLNECYRVVTEKRGLMPRNEAQLFVFSLTGFCSAPYDFEVTRKAWQIQDRSDLGWWDCTLLASALLANCNVFLSEDMQHERAIETMIILNPFKLAPDFEFSK